MQSELNFVNTLDFSLVSIYVAIVIVYSYTGLKVGWMTRTMWVTWVTFLMGQVGLIRKLNYLDVTRH